MKSNIYIFFSAAAILIVFYLIYKIIKRKKISGESQKITPKVSLVLVVKNNEKLLEYVITKILKERNDIEEVVIADLGSIDSTLEVAHKLMDKDSRAKILNITKAIITENDFSIIKRHVKGEIVLILELHKIGIENPNVDVPELFKFLDTVLVKKFPRADTRIDGTKLLHLDEYEREKNSYMLKEYIADPLDNININMKKLLGQIEKNNALKKQMMDIQQYVDRTDQNINMLLHLITPVKFSSESMNDNMISMFKEYGQRYRVSINYKMLGIKREFKNPIKSLILEMTQELLYTIIKYNLSSGIEVMSRYGSKQFTLLFKYESGYDEDTLLNPDSGLSYYVVQSIQNRLGLIGGKMRIKVKSQGKINVLIQIPIDNTTCISNKKIKQ